MHFSEHLAGKGNTGRIAMALLLLFTIHLNLFSQNSFFKKYSVAEGLGSSKIYSLIQGRNDYIWLGTESGVSRFDGDQFNSFSQINGLAPGGVFSLCEDSTGRVWMGHLNGGLSCSEGDHFYKVHIDSIKIASDITSIVQSGRYIWLTTSADGAVRIPFPSAGDTLVSGHQYKGEEGLSDQVFRSYLDREGNLYCITDAFIKKYIPRTNTFETYSPEGLTKYFSVIVMYEDSKGNYWYGTHNGGLYKFERATGEMKVFDSGRDGLSSNYITSIAEDYKGDIWVGTWGGGITRFSGDEIKVFNKSNGLDASYIHAIIEDKEKNILIADHNEGLNVYKGDYLVTFNDSRILPERSVWAISQDNRGYYWFGTNSGISVLNPGDKTGNQVTIFNNENSNIGNQIHFIKSDRSGSIWIGTRESGVSRYDLSSRRFIYDIALNSILNQNGIITALEVDNENNLWIGTNDGLAFWNKGSEEGMRFTQINGLCSNYVTALYCDRKGVLWIGSENGLTRHIPGSGKFFVEESCSGMVIRSICETEDGRLWLGTTSGIYALKDDNIVLKPTEENGLLFNSIKFLLPYGNQNIYIGTSQGLSRYNLRDGSLASFNEQNGYTGIESKDNACFSDNKGRLWFGTANGVTMLDPNQEPQVNANPSVHFSRLDISWKRREMKDGMKLGYKENAFEFYYYSVCLYNPSSVRYKVMLTGPEADADWRPVTDQKTAFYSALRPGHYTFLVKACNSFGYWNDAPVSFSFTIRPPFYSTAWFFSFCIIVAVIMIVIYIKMREAKLLKEKMLLEDKVEERTAEVVQKSFEIEAKNRDITASIRYAERIQSAMLPPENTFNETFVLFLPKDIVSGDFYWMYDGGDRKYIAAVDCTGHGVPGAFMSIIGHNSLNKIVKENGIKKPSEILNSLHQEVVHALLQRTEKAIKDGMDISLIAYDKVNEIVEYAGAFHPLYHVRDGAVETIKADRFPIGFSENGDPTHFTNHVINVEKGDMLYMCSDGYADQFGGGDDTKFKSARIKTILSKVYDKPVGEQKRRLEVAIRQWMGSCPQVDDILFIGTRIN